jgi:hypothetical protein
MRNQYNRNDRYDRRERQQFSPGRRSYDNYQRQEPYEERGQSLRNRDDQYSDRYRYGDRDTGSSSDRYGDRYSRPYDDSYSRSSRRNWDMQEPYERNFSGRDSYSENQSPSVNRRPYDRSDRYSMNNYDGDYNEGDNRNYDEYDEEVPNTRYSASQGEWDNDLEDLDDDGSVEQGYSNPRTSYY